MRRVAGKLALHGRHHRRGARQGEGIARHSPTRPRARDEGRGSTMNSTLHLTVTTPGQILVESGDVVAVRAEDQSGSFGILPGHADLLTVLGPSVVRWRTADGATRFCAVRGGVFTVSAGRNVAVACRE